MQKTVTNLPSDFDAVTYLILNPDVKNSELSPEEHYIHQGKKERRTYKTNAKFISQNTLDEINFSKDFLEKEYLDSNVDTKSVYSKTEIFCLEKQNEFIFDKKEFFSELFENLNTINCSDEHLSTNIDNINLNNRPSLPNNIKFKSAYKDLPEAIGSFGSEETLDVESYYYIYPDVMKALGGDENAARQHYINHGRSEGRIGPGMSRLKRRLFDIKKFDERPFGINIFGPFTTISGLGTAARAMAFAIKKSGIPFEIHTFEAIDGNVKFDSRSDTTNPKYRINVICANADFIGRLFAAYKNDYFSNAYNIGVWQWELASFRPDWYFDFDGIDEIWTNSQFQMDSISSISPVPVTKILIPVTTQDHHTSHVSSKFYFDTDEFIFLLPFDVGSTSARKNPFAAITAFKAVHVLYPKTRLVLKYHGASADKRFLRSVTAALAGVTGITIIAEAFPADDMAALRARCDCLVSPHRSEGFGLNIAEFMAMGKPVIATNYSGNLEFFDETVGFPITYELREITDPVGPYRYGYVWAEPDIGSIEQQMHKVLTDPQDVHARVTAAKLRIQHTLGSTVIASNICNRISSLELDQKLPSFFRNIGRSDILTRNSFVKNNTSKNNKSSFNGNWPLLSIVMPVYNVPAKYLRACLESVFCQTYSYWELCICDDGSTSSETLEVLSEYIGISPKIKILLSGINSGIARATNSAASMAIGEYIVLLDNDDLMMPTALAEVASVINSDKCSDVIYTDEDKIDENDQLIDHYYKPDWSPEHLESVMYVLHMLVIRKALFLKLGGLRHEYSGAQDYDLMLRCSRLTDNIRHIPKILYRWRAIPGSAAAVVDAKPYALLAGMRALQDHALAKYGIDAQVEEGLLTGTFRLRRITSKFPSVTLLILTANATKVLPERGIINMVENFVDSIVKNTDYPNFEIIVVDNDTLTKEQIIQFNEIGVQVRNFRIDGDFNYASKANYAINQSRTENIVLLNDDMEVIRPDWLKSLIEVSHDSAVGAVGARLLHADNTIQHVGVVTGVNGSAAHVYHSYPRNFVGYNGFTHLIRNYSAVTAACLATRKSVMAQIGGFNDKFAIDFNDIDLCLRIRDAGYRIVYTPYAELYHYEGSTAVRTTQNPCEVELFNTIWSESSLNDPYYNPNLTNCGLDYALRS